MALVLPTPKQPPATAEASSLERRAHQHWLKGQAYAAKHQWHEALVAFESASAWQAEAAYPLAAIHASIKAGRSDYALQLVARMHAHSPLVLLSYTLESHAYLALDQPAQAAQCLQNMPSVLVKDHHAWISLAIALQRMRQHVPAVQAFLAGLALRMDQSVAHFRLGMSFKDLGLKEQAAECVRTALILGLGTSELAARGQLLFLEREACRWPQAKEALDELNVALVKTSEGEPIETGPFPHAVFVSDPLAQLKVAKHYAAHVARSVRLLPKVVVKGGSRRIKLGYVSADFHQHATSQLMVQMLESHDQNEFEVTLFSSGPDDGSALRQRMMRATEHFVDLRGLGFEAMAQKIRQHAIDILVDLKGATHDTLLPVFACKPAPLQISWLGFPGTSGANFIDYFVGDPVVSPLSHSAHFSEAIAQMPICYQPNDSQRPRPLMPDRQAWGIAQDALVLCGFHQSYKISEAVFDVWCKILHAEPRSILWLLQWNLNVKMALEEAARARGIDPNRLVFVPLISAQDHLKRLCCADLYLDTWPCNAHTTASEALWVGVPVVTIIGSTFAQRVAASLLTAVDLPQLICETQDAYENKVLSLLRDASLRDSLRQHLANQSSNSLFNGQQFAVDFEALLMRMWQRKLKGLKPIALAAELAPVATPKELFKV